LVYRNLLLWTHLKKYTRRTKHIIFCVREARSVRKIWKFGSDVLLTGLLVMLPVYLTALLLLKAMKTVSRLVEPLARLLPDWIPAQNALSFLLVVILCFLVGMAVRTSLGRAARNRVENSILQKLPGYTMFRGMTRQLSGDSGETAWKAALAEIEDALVPAFIIEELDNGSFTVFVPSVPTPMAGAIYILAAHRVHPLDVPFTQVLKAVSRWGSGSKELVSAMEGKGTPSLVTR
jgi:uncharacterized membrane protein